MTKLNDLQTYTTPRFEDTTPSKALAEAQRIVERVEAQQKDLQRLMEISEGYIRLYKELITKKVNKVQDLPEERRSYWKQKIYWPLQPKQT